MNKNDQIISETTKKQADEQELSHDMIPARGVNASYKQSLLLAEIVNQLKEMNAKLDSIHEEIWDANQRRSDEL